MKKTNRIMYYILLIMIIVGCTDNEVVEQYDEVRITASLSSDSRTSYLSENGVTKVSWVEGDAIGLFTAEQWNIKHVATSSEETSDIISSNEKLHLSEGDSVFAWYPFNAHINNESPYYEDIKAGRIPLLDANMQDYDSGLSAYDYMFAQGVVKNNQLKLQFEHIFAILRITFPTKMLKEGTTLRISSTDCISVYGDELFYNIKTKEFYIDPGKETLLDKEMQVILDVSSLKKEETTIDVAIIPQPESAVIEIQNYYLNYCNLNTLYVGKAPEGGMQAGNVYKINLTEDRFVDRKEEDLKALKALYEATNGDNWKNNTNWFTDNPLHSWYGLNKGEDLLGENVKFDFVSALRLENNILRGTLPKEFVYFMDNVINIDISGNALVGKIPQEILEHPRWNKLGWNIIKQSAWYGGGFDYSEGINLKTKDAIVPLFVENKQSTVHDILAQNKLTYVFNAGATDMFEGISDERVNKYLDYCNKGFGIVVTVGQFQNVTYDECIIHVKEKQNNGLPLDILWAKEFGDTSFGNSGDMYLFDNEGNLVYYWAANGGIKESWYNEKLDSILHARLGEPEEHPIYETKYYTSTDYSKDGEVMTLQKATVGKGIDLVFMGDSYVDKDMETDGKYEKNMKASMEYFFEVEPYKSFRNRFNVYAVKVISPNAESAEGCKQRINYDNEICFEYAGKIPGIDLDKVTIVNVVNRPDVWFVSGYTNMYETGASVAHIERGGPSSIIVHEAGGHGFAKLLDEYIYSGYEHNKVSNNQLATFQNMIKTDYHNRGWGANVDVTSDPSKVIWSHFLEDERYKKEVGVYQGAWLYPFDLWRPSENSVMNNDYSRFNAPSREAIYKRIMELSEGEDWTYNYEDFVTYDAVNRNTESRSVSTSSQSRQKVHKDHRPPTFIKGSWRDAAKGKSKIVVPFR